MWEPIRELVLFAFGFMLFSFCASVTVLITIAIVDTVAVYGGSKWVEKMLERMKRELH